jgi:hypothetical protein
VEEGYLICLFGLKIRQFNGRKRMCRLYRDVAKICLRGCKPNTYEKSMAKRYRGQTKHSVNVGLFQEFPTDGFASSALGPKLTFFCKSIGREGSLFGVVGVERTRGRNNELSWFWSHLPTLSSVRTALSCLEMRTAAKSC